MAEAQETESPNLEPVVERLERLSALFALAFDDEIGRARQELLKDPLNKAIFTATKGKWVGSGDLQRRIKNAGNRTIRERLAELADRGLLARRGDGPAREFRSRGLV